MTEAGGHCRKEQKTVPPCLFSFNWSKFQQQAKSRNQIYHSMQRSPRDLYKKRVKLSFTQTRGDKEKMEGLQSNEMRTKKYQFIIRYIHSPSGAQDEACIRCLQKGILIRNQFVSLSRSEVCTVMWPELWSEFSISLCVNFMHRRHILWKKEKKEERSCLNIQ